VVTVRDAGNTPLAAVIGLTNWVYRSDENLILTFLIAYVLTRPLAPPPATSCPNWPAVEAEFWKSWEPA
jgi:hypothetical protein